LTEHSRFGFDTADTPSDHTQSIDHRGVRVSTYECIWEGEPLLVLYFDHNHFGQIFQVDLVDNACSGWYDPQIVKGGLSPVKTFITFAVALEFQVGVAHQGIRAGEEIYLYGVIDDQVNRNQWVDLFWITAQASDGRAHGSEIDDGGYTGKILHHDARRLEGKSGSIISMWGPSSQVDDILAGNLNLITLA
jgi:hypothetical protein